MLVTLGRLLGGISPVFVAALISGLAFGASGFMVERSLKNGEIAKIELGYSEAKVKAVAEAAQEQKRLDDINLHAAVVEALGQQKIAIDTRLVLDTVERHVHTTDHIPCISLGFVRVLDAEVLGRNPDSLALPTGVSDDTCAPISPADVARSIAANYGACRANAQQLDTLIGIIRDAAPGRRATADRSLAAHQ